MISNISADPITLIKKTGPLLSMQKISTASNAQLIYTWTRIHKNYSDCWAAVFFLSKLPLCMHTPLCQAAAVTKKEEGKGVFMWRVWIRYKGERLRWVYPADCHFTVKSKLAHPKRIQHVSVWPEKLRSTPFRSLLLMSPGRVSAEPQRPQRGHTAHLLHSTCLLCSGEQQRHHD